MTVHSGYHGVPCTHRLQPSLEGIEGANGEGSPWDIRASQQTRQPCRENALPQIPTTHVKRGNARGTGEWDHRVHGGHCCWEQLVVVQSSTRHPDTARGHTIEIQWLKAKAAAKVQHVRCALQQFSRSSQHHIAGQATGRHGIHQGAWVNGAVGIRRLHRAPNTHRHTQGRLCET